MFLLARFPPPTHSFSWLAFIGKYTHWTYKMFWCLYNGYGLCYHLLKYMCSIKFEQITSLHTCISIQKRYIIFYPLLKTYKGSYTRNITARTKWYIAHWMATGLFFLPVGNYLWQTSKTNFASITPLNDRLPTRAMNRSFNCTSQWVSLPAGHTESYHQHCPAPCLFVFCFGGPFCFRQALAQLPSSFSYLCKGNDELHRPPQGLGHGVE